MSVLERSWDTSLEGRSFTPRSPSHSCGTRLVDPADKVCFPVDLLDKQFCLNNRKEPSVNGWPPDQISRIKIANQRTKDENEKTRLQKNYCHQTNFVLVFNTPCPICLKTYIKKLTFQYIVRESIIKTLIYSKSVLQKTVSYGVLRNSEVGNANLHKIEMANRFI